MQIEFWRRVIRNIEHTNDEGASHPYQVLLHLVARKPSISRAKCALALVAADDSAAERVNIAARLETLADPGAICIFEDAYRQIGSKIDITAQDLGEQPLKNVSEPIRVYAVRAPAPTAPRVTSDPPARRPQLSFGVRLS